jgi:Ca2+-transporting ATPase
MRSERTSLARLGLWSNRFLPTWTAVTAAALALIMTIPALRSALRLTSMNGIEWLGVIAIPTVAMAWIEIAKRLPRQKPG